MGIITPEGGTPRHLRSDNLIGRSRKCDFRLNLRTISGLHANVFWSRTTWLIRDLNTPNGTYVNDARLLPGESRALLQGDRLQFGTSGPSWTVTSIAVPTSFAVSAEGMEMEAESGNLYLPNPQNPEWTIGQTTAGLWRAWKDDADIDVEDGSQVLAAGQRWTLHLPELLSQTDPEPNTPMNLKELVLVFRVSLDEETVHLEAHARGRLLDMGARAHHYTLLTLARIRMEDAKKEGLGEAEHGWIHRDDLLKMLRLRSSVAYSHVHRARMQFDKEGIISATDLVEQRPHSAEWRIGVGRLQEVSL